MFNSISLIRVSLLALASPEVDIKAITINFGLSPFISRHIIDDCFMVIRKHRCRKFLVRLLFLITWHAYSNPSSSNVFRIWYALERHFELHPEHRHKFPTFQPSLQDDRPLLAKGSSEPLEGPSVFAQYFHGRYYTFASSGDLV